MSFALVLRLVGCVALVSQVLLGTIRADSWKTEGTHELPGIGLSEFLAEHLDLPGVNDHGIDFGGIGSDLWRGKGDGPGVFWMITDRGPNGEDPRSFPVPEFTPFILKVRAANGVIEILEAIPITGQAVAANGVTGLPNLENTTEPPALNEEFFACDQTTELDPNSHGLDTEGLVRTLDGHFWVAEEYSPSLVKIDPQGKVVKRYFPIGLPAYLAPITGYPTEAASIPSIFGLKRKLNRGFEGLTLSPDEKTLYVALQSPLVNPDVATGNESRITRILAFDVASERVTAEYVYRFQFTGPARDDDEFDVPSIPGNTARARPRDMKISALAMLDQHRMLVLERTDFKAKIYRVDLRPATNILGGVWDEVTTSPSLETKNADGALEAAGVTPLPKEHVVTLDSTQGFPQKIEGLTVLDGQTIAIANDNDFGVGGFAIEGDSCLLEDSGRESQLIVLRLDSPLKK
jgi:Esterase-like activity of phytase